ncbi:MAG TPA: hypothetical protein PLM75_07440 [bacterium]|nr:hypothetical protein [bacterium]
MKFFLITLLVCLPTFINAANISTKFDASIYGFINATIIYGDKNPAWHTQYRANPDYGKSDLNFTMETSRIGLILKAPEEKKSL